MVAEDVHVEFVPHEQLLAPYDRGPNGAILLAKPNGGTYQLE